MLDLAEEVPPQDLGVPAVRPASAKGSSGHALRSLGEGGREGQPALGFGSPVARDGALQHLEGRGMNGVHGQHDLVLAFDNTHVQVRAAISLIQARVGEFRVVSPATGDARFGLHRSLAELDACPGEEGSRNDADDLTCA